MLAGQLIDRGAIGKVIQVQGMGPIASATLYRPDWFFERARYGGILTDISGHNFEQMLTFTGSEDAEVLSSSIGNFGNPDHPELDDYGDAHIALSSGATGFVRVDWFTPDGLRTWGDGRTFILGTEGYIELRKYIDVTTDNGGGQVLLVDDQGEHRINATGEVGYPFFGDLILDVLNRTENAMTQATPSRPWSWRSPRRSRRGNSPADRADRGTAAAPQTEAHAPPTGPTTTMVVGPVATTGPRAAPWRAPRHWVRMHPCAGIRAPRPSRHLLQNGRNLFWSLGSRKAPLKRSIWPHDLGRDPNESPSVLTWASQ